MISKLPMLGDELLLPRDMCSRRSELTIKKIATRLVAANLDPLRTSTKCEAACRQMLKRAPPLVSGMDRLSLYGRSFTADCDSHYLRGSRYPVPATCCAMGVAAALTDTVTAPRRRSVQPAAQNAGWPWLQLVTSSGTLKAHSARAKR